MVSEMFSYLLNNISHDAFSFHRSANQSTSYTNKLIKVSMLGCLATIIQSMGGFFPGVGYALSPFAMVPILISTIISVSFGWMAYVLTTLLLVIIMPSELFIFPFTTGLLGIGMGIGFLLLKKRLFIVTLSSIMLTLGICILLYIVQYPILGPLVSSRFNFSTLAFVYLFSFFYSWAWTEMSRLIWRRLSKTIV